ncbi:MAG: hypothetical protein K9H48_20875 [Melioribacteraceae bacterium]|nr:hypothetical protein [Melioribacteraceae bacterium]MCF8394302.1 hypothetical protein [Melioribacteraceae bacterium]MCF8419981.1 hypothetical protein [Melioribacteraceae bacterium]
MNSREFKWSPTEKKLARSIFDKAFNNEMANLKAELVNRVSKDMSNEEVWNLEHFLVQKRKDIDFKFDYRYSQLIRVFGILVRGGLISLEDLNGLGNDKVEAIRLIASVR